MKTLSLISKFQEESGFFSIVRSENNIEAKISVDFKNLLVEFEYFDGEEVTSSVYHLKSEEKGINLLQKAEKQFATFRKEKFIPELHDMERDFDSYISEKAKLKTIY